jgi:hypothetical protein
MYPTTIKDEDAHLIGILRLLIERLGKIDKLIIQLIVIN